MPKRSAGLLVFRRRGGQVEVLIAHPGGPFWTTRDEGAWSILKGEYGLEEDPLAAARREFVEETGHPPPDGPAIPLGNVAQRSGKLVTAFAVEGEFDPAELRGEVVTMEWPPRSGRVIAFPEVDRVEWFTTDAARPKLLAGQAVLLDRLVAILDQTA